MGNPAASAATPPVALGDTYYPIEGNPLTVGAANGVLRNDRDADGAALFAQQTSSAHGGTFRLSTTGAFVYTPPALAGARYDYATYRACEQARPTVCSASVAVQFRIQAPGQRPVGGNDHFTATEDTNLVITRPGLLSNDRDPAGTRLTVGVPIQSTVRGKLTTVGDGSFLYEPYEDLNGPDYFTYQATDALGLSSYPVTVDIDVLPVEDPVQAVADVGTTAEDAPNAVVVPVLANDSNVDADQVLTVVANSQGTNPALAGQVSCTTTTCSYRPGAANRFGRDTFTYTVTDGVTTALGTVTMIVNSVNDAPVARDDTYTTPRGTCLLVDARRGLMANDSDVDGFSGDFLNVARYDQAGSAGNTVKGSAGAVYVDNGGTLQFYPARGFVGTATFNYSIVDSKGAVDTARVAITVT